MKLYSIKTKMILAITALMVSVFLMISFLFISEKKVELADDVFVGVKAFAELTAPDVAELTDLYLLEEGFVYFNREIHRMFEQNLDVRYVSVVDYEGNVLYDSDFDADKKYDGTGRKTIFAKINQIKSENPSIVMSDGTKGGVNIYYLKNGDYVDYEENLINSPESGFKFDHFVQPASDKYSVVYGVTYENMEVRVSRMISRILATAGFGLILGILLALYMATRVTRPVRKLAEGAAAISKGSFQYQVIIDSKDELGSLGASFNQMAQDLEKSLEARVYKERLGREVELARQVQKEIIPAKLPKLGGLDVAAGLVSATEVGGDMYDFIPTKDGFLIYLGDVTGHGIPACIVGAIANSLFYSYSGSGDLKKIVCSVNDVLKEKTMATMFMTLCMLKWDSVANKLTYVNAGHEPVLHYRASSGDVVEGKKDGMAIGMVKGAQCPVNEVDPGMQVGDVLVTYSDGLLEAWKNEKEHYGMERLKASVLAASKLKGGKASADEIQSSILADVAKFTGGFEQKDDQTILVLKRG
ncbi:SpoIIE family protein phosphatase [Candidatus Peregrinibacteria bacterium]|jgi:serine phosphatase RsbU (regulator of sigma subunit)|nr:SpoIIE family protein phosphatase [Candidatus Peregrinibacteria bacterium]MBT4148362.1 SpoIIE family protein phosphatase [Candidatus Peregrinibacteria bacterium]MBT4366671.1 SpoIIE family protein phosphatase [Candidatus Peregrinibacteria bacterium]MBT4455885.1 SpoIIE family protein phosphatase [Candidatus Peregrinibacteria bacterium]